MKIPAIDNAEKYVGLYVMDLGQQCEIGYTAEEVGALLESRDYSDAKIYKIYRAKPDGTMELHGVVRDKFQLESGMFFYCRDERSGLADFQELIEWNRHQKPPCRAKLHLARGSDTQLIIALIYPAEYENEIGNWLADSGFKGAGPVDAGISQVERYYNGQYELLQSEQFRSAGIEENQPIPKKVYNYG